MTEHTPSLDVALAFTRAWSSHDMTAAARYVDDCIIFEGPLVQTTGAKPYLDDLALLANAVDDLEMIAAYGDDEQAMLMYELHTDKYGTLTCARYMTIRDGRIIADKQAFDSYGFRTLRAARHLR